MTQYKYEEILTSYRKALSCFEELTDIDSHKYQFKEKPNDTLINEALYLMFKEGASLAESYMNNGKKLSLLEENIASFGNQAIHKYEGKKSSDGSTLNITAQDVLKDAQTAFYKGADYKIKNPDTYFKKDNFLTAIAKEPMQIYKN